MLASKPLYHNSLAIKSIKDINLIDNFPENIQTGCCNYKKKFQNLANLLLKEGLKIVSIGSMTYYNHPWDVSTYAWDGKLDKISKW